MKNANPQPVYLKDYTVPPYLCDDIHLEFDLQEDYALVTSQFKLYANPNYQDPRQELILNGEKLELEELLLDGVPLDPSQYRLIAGALILYSPGDEFELTIRTRIKPQENTLLMGLYKSSGNFCTQCEAEGFRHITYFLDRPDVMVRYTTTIFADESSYPILLSNGNPIAAGKIAGGRHWVRWQDPFKKPSYLFALVAGDLESVEDFFLTQSGRRVTVRIFVEKGNLSQCAHAMTAVKNAMRWDEEQYGREYDLDIYMIVAVSDFNMGAMENKGLNIFNTKYLLAVPETATDDDFIHISSVVAHEYFHNWTGNRITCRDWFQLSLKEGLTIFRDQSFTADQISKSVARIQSVNALRNTQFPEDAGPLAHPVRPESYIEINNFYTPTIYEKGAEIIRMMQTILGEDLFRQGMDLYFNRFDGQAATIEDFVQVMEEAAKIDLTQFKRWYSQAGTPLLTIEDAYDAAKKTYTLTVQQSMPLARVQSDKQLLHIPLRMGLLDRDGREILNELLQIKKAKEIFYFENMAEKPVPSLLRHFSAPVKINYAYTDSDLQLLFKHDTDEFNRWEAGQKYAVNVMLRLIQDYRQRKSLNVPADFVQAFQFVLEKRQADPFLLAEMLTLPSEKYLSEQMPVVDVDAIHAVREWVLLEMAKQLKTLFLAMYNHNHTPQETYQFNLQEVGKRQLKNLCLGYLMKLCAVLNPEERQTIIAYAQNQFQMALSQNMTDTMGALRSLVNVESEEREKALSAFYQTWQKNPLVIDKWFALSASINLPGTLKRVKALLSHPDFDLKNPNKVYALIGTFTRMNAINFHSLSGEGYAFLADVVLELNVLNPLIAARMVTPLTSWRRYDPARQQLMKNQLEMILNHKKISKDVYELVSKSLQEEVVTSG